MTDPLLQALQNMVWDTPKPIEYRVYHDPQGRVISYSNSDDEGDYILVDRETWAANRYDWRVIKGKLVPPRPESAKLKPSENGTNCHPRDITIVVTDSPGQKWQIKNHED